MQTRLGSFVEANANVVIGFAINWTANILVLPVLWDAANPKASAFYIGLVFTAISYVRQFVLRRWFNRMKFGNAAPKPASYVDPASGVTFADHDR